MMSFLITLVLHTHASSSLIKENYVHTFQPDTSLFSALNSLSFKYIYIYTYTGNVFKVTWVVLYWSLPC